MSKVTGTLGTRLHNLPGKYGLYYFELTVHFPKFFEIQGVKRLENRRSIILVIRYVLVLMHYKIGLKGGGKIYIVKLVVTGVHNDKNKYFCP